MASLQNVLFVPHGAPTFALEPGEAGAAMSRVVAQLPTPKAIVVFSPHWDTRVPTVSTATELETIHDFYGFPAPLYDIQYPAHGSPDLAQQILGLLQAAGLEAAEREQGLDHGAWQPLRQMFPDAQVPIVPVSMQMRAGPAQAYRVGQALAELAEQGVLIVASGNLTHNLHDWQLANALGGQTPAYVQRFTDWLEAHLTAQNWPDLLNYRRLNPDGAQAHPSEDHLLPLFVALGAAGPASKPQAFYRGINNHVIAMDGYAFSAE